jgi:hypothetical protein
MQPDRPNRAANDGNGREAETATLLQRALALITLLALLASAAFTSWWVLTDQIDLRRALGEVATEFEQTGAINDDSSPG